ncbi:MAG: hypothetical protein KF696_08640 [Planctomycetes bacterium]|nr:hypothetical protein [Planctomycetota bacterium]MCW8136664.1 hypothetical protein [Planctomycetota bacterium]
MRFCLPLCAVVLLLAANPAPTSADANAVLAWRCPELTGLRYVRTNEMPRAYIGGPRFGDDLVVLRANVSSTGAVTLPGNWGAPGAEIAFRIAAAVSGKPVKTTRWSAKFDHTSHPRALAVLPDVVSAEYTLKGIEGDIAQISVKATGEDTEAAGANQKKGPVSIQMDVQFDLANGWLHAFKGTYTGTEYGREAKHEFVYELRGQVSFDSRPAFDAAVARAIQKGCKVMDDMPESWRRADYAALAAYTYLQCSRGVSDQHVQQALRRMIKEDGSTRYIQLYHAAAVVLAIEAKYITDDERRLVAKGQRPGAIKRALTDADKSAMKHAIDYIAGGQADNAPGLYSYGSDIGKGQPPDLSNTQFAALALAAAARCEIELPVGLVRDMGENLAGFQQADGPDVYRIKGKGKRGWEYERYPDKARGFAYKGPGMPVSVAAGNGSMTGAGVCSLLLLLDTYETWPAERQKKEIEPSKAKAWMNAVQKNADCGIAWLTHNYSVSENPMAGGNDYYYYYLYALERVGAFAPTEYIGEHEWYLEGALTLLLRQSEAGAWGKIEDTCFALLFLGRATTPARRPITGK